MVNIHIDFANTCGPIKAMNGVNNGPLGSYVRQTSGFELDETHNADLVYDEPYEDWETSIRLHLVLFTTCYIEIIPVQ